MDSTIVVERVGNDVTPNYEYDTRWKPQLSWSFLSWSQQQKMEQQAAQRELAWQKIADKLGPLLMADAAWSFTNKEAIYSGHLDNGPTGDGVEAQTRSQERIPIISNQHKNYNNFNYQTNSPTTKLYSKINQNAKTTSNNIINNNNNLPSTLLNTPPDSTRSGSRFKDNIIISFQSSHDKDECQQQQANTKRHQRRDHEMMRGKFDYDFRGKGRFLTVSGTIILLIIILFSILVLMALGILPHNMRYH